MKTKLQTAIKTIPDLASQNSSKRKFNFSRLEIVSEIGKSLFLLGIQKLDPDLYEIIDAYNARIVDLSPLNRSLYPSVQETPSADELHKKRDEVTNAYRLLANNYKSLPVLESLPEKAETNLVTVNNDGISTYNAYLNIFNRLHERIESVTPEDVDLDRKKVVDFQIPEFNEVYTNPQIEKLKMMRERGFENQTLPGAEFIKLGWSFGTFVEDNNLGKMADFDNDSFEKIFYLKGTKFCCVQKNNGRLNDKESIIGRLKIDNGKKHQEIYLLGKILPGPVLKSEAELNSELKSLAYKKVFGFQAPKYIELENFLKRIHKVKGDYQLNPKSKEELVYPLPDEVFEIYCAAEDSDLFKQKENKLEFLVLEKSKPIDPILNGKLYGKLNFPICWWV